MTCLFNREKINNLEKYISQTTRNFLNYFFSICLVLQPDSQFYCHHDTALCATNCQNSNETTTIGLTIHITAQQHFNLTTQNTTHYQGASELAINIQKVTFQKIHCLNPHIHVTIDADNLFPQARFHCIKLVHLFKTVELEELLIPANSIQSPSVKQSHRRQSI